MRELHECRNEIFLRSQRRIHRRRQARKGILTGCLVMALCVAGIGVLHGRKPTNGPVDGSAMGGVPVQVPGVYISGLGVDGQITDADRVEQVSRCLGALFHTDDAGGTDHIYGDPLPPKGETEGIAAYTIHITELGQETQQYTLEGNWLYNHQTHRRVELTESQLAKLKDLLNLT